MSKKDSSPWQSRLNILRYTKDETKQGVFAIVFFILGVFFVLSSFHKSGPVGEKIFVLFKQLFGLGYFLLPLFFFILTLTFLKSLKQNFNLSKVIFSFFALAASLGILDLIIPGEAGIVGRGISSSLMYLVDFYASIIFLAGVLVIFLLLIFDAPLDADFWKHLIIGGKKKDGDANNGLLESEQQKVDEASGGANSADAQNKNDEKRTSKSRGAQELSEDEKNGFELNQKRTQGGTMKYVPLPLSLLERDSGKPGVGDIKANANLIKRTLQNFGIDVEMDEISIGPSITRYALKPAEGVKLSRIVALQDNLALALAAHPIRIEAPIPGKSLVGIEIPNSTKTTVGLGTLLSSPEFQESDKSLLISLGKGISGKSHFANLGKMPHLLIAGATGSGKTCAKDTYVLSEKGILTFDELCPLPLNSEINYSIRVATRDGIEATSKNYNNGICDFNKITTEEGLTIEVTDEHPLWVIHDGEMKWQNSGSIQKGEYVAISRGSKLFGKKTSINFIPEPNKTNKSREIKIPTIMSEELGLFMGLLTADGGLTIHYRVVYTQANTEVLAIYSALLKNLFGLNSPYTTKSGKSNKAKDIVVNSRQLKDFLTHLDLQPVGARKKQIPRSIRESSPEVIKAFIKGLIRNDGHISPVAGLEITLASEKLLQQLQIILLNFGIVSSLHSKKVKGYEHNTYWRLAVYGADFVLYAKEIGFLTDEERKKAESFLTIQRNTNKNIIPTLSPILKKLSLVYRKTFAQLTNMGWQYQNNALVPKYAFRSLASYNSGVRNPSYGALERILTFYEPLADSAPYKKIAEISRDNFYWARVASIEKTSGEGYDFEVPGSNSFVGNGFVNHNSVMIHSIITSLLYRNSPENIKFIMIDPKRVELTLYNKIPHLLTPVITDAKKAILALKWAGKEMDRRYDILESETVRDIESYHKNILEPELKKLETKKDASGNDEVKLPEMMPYIVIVLDELADIMQTYPRELESAIVRLAQMSRAVGIHLMLSTQRPSVNIITGLIKANIPNRIALQVSSQIDSRTILDTGGAEKLLGAGDLLYLGGEMSKPQRMQSAFIGETEVKKVVKFLVQNYAGEVPTDINLTETAKNSLFEASLEDTSLADDDEMYEDARLAVIEAGKASTSYLQRKLGLGYARAARLMDSLEQRGVIGPGDGAKPREVLGAPPKEETEPTEQNNL
ncbi:MAG: DNA translocase FtsK [Candidatus Taylorbacteria bacterium]